MNESPIKNTLEYFMKLADTEDIEESLLFVKPAVKTLQNRLRDESLVVDEVYELYFAAATLAFYNATASSEFSHYTSFKAGNVGVNFSPKSHKENAEQLLETALSLAKPYLRSGIILKSTGGNI